MFNIRSLVKKETTATIPYFAIPAFKVTLKYCGKPELKALADECTLRRPNLQTREMVEEMDHKKFKALIAKKVILGWEGLTLERLALIIPVDVPEGTDMQQTVDATYENKTDLIETSLEFDRWVTETVGDLSKFAEEKKEAELKN